MKTLLKNIISKFGYQLVSKKFIDDIDFIKQYAIDGELVVFDVGANIGNYAKKVVAIANKVHLHCFEPFAESFQMLQTNSNNYSITFNQLALSDVNGVKEFHLNSFSETNSLLKSVRTGLQSLDNGMQEKAVITVSTKTIDSYCEENNIHKIDVLKIDVQGAELLVLKGASEMLEQNKIRLIRVETIFEKLYEDQSDFSDVFTFLQNKKYHFQGFGDTIYINKKLMWADAFFIQTSH